MLADGVEEMLPGLRGKHAGAAAVRHVLAARGIAPDSVRVAETARKARVAAGILRRTLSADELEGIYDQCRPAAAHRA